MPLKKVNSMGNPREVAFLALLRFKEGSFAEHFLEKSYLSDRDLKLAKHIVFGTVKRLRSLAYLSLQLSDKLRLKEDEKLLLYSALYQFFFMDKIPLFALVNETVKIAKKYFGKYKSGFFNAVLKKLAHINFSFDKPKDLAACGYYYSYPDFFIKKLLEEYSSAVVEEILKVQNMNFNPTARVRGGFSFIEIENAAVLKKVAVDEKYYIQNTTPALLIEKLSKKSMQKPKKILDLCAAPGGKALVLFDLYPSANMYVNDLSSKRVDLLKANLLQKYKIPVTVFNQPAEEFVSDTKFDLIVLDVPCSNSGVLSKRHEARWRLNENALRDLQVLQTAILNNALNLLAPGGRLWYLTCSILKDENECLIKKFVEDRSLRLFYEYKILPDAAGNDGGFAASLGV